MRSKTLFSLLIMTAVVVTFGLNEAKAGLPGLPGLPAPSRLPGPPAVRVTGYLPAPPGVHVMIDSGRPYYVERERRVYIERERPARHYKKYKKHHEDNGRKKGHYKHGRYDD